MLPHLLLALSLACGTRTVPPPVTNAPAPASCSDGMVRGPDTAGHCCWEGQAWNGLECVGLPLACPPGMRVDVFKYNGECTRDPCPDGEILVDEIHCCWPATSWSREAETCTGTPSCPEGMGPFGSYCVPDVDVEGLDEGVCPTAGAGVQTPLGDGAGPGSLLDAKGHCPRDQFATGDGSHCCPAFQAWSSTRHRCVGPWRAQDRFIVIGEADKTRIDEVVRSHLTGPESCYRPSLHRSPDLAGIILLQFVIIQDGTVSSAKVQASSLAVPALEDCIVSRLKVLRFPPLSGDGIVVVRYPLLIQPE